MERHDAVVGTFAHDDVDGAFEQADVRQRLPRDIDGVPRSGKVYDPTNVGLRFTAQGRDIEAARLRLVGHEHADAARRRDQRDTIGPWITSLRGGASDIEPLIEAFCAIDAELPENAIVDLVGSRKRRRVRRGRRGTDLGTADFEHHDGLSIAPACLQRLDKLATVATSFHVGEDHARLVVLREIGEAVCEVDVGLVACRHPTIEGQASIAGGHCGISSERSALADQRRVSGRVWQLREERREAGHHARRVIDDPEAIRPQQPHAGLGRFDRKRALDTAAVFPEFGEARREDDTRFDALGDGVIQRGGQGGRGHGKHR